MRPSAKPFWLVKLKIYLNQNTKSFSNQWLCTYPLVEKINGLWATLKWPISTSCLMSVHKSGFKTIVIIINNYSPKWR